MLRRLAAVMLTSALVFAGTPAALGWNNGDHGGNGFGTHDWILHEATRIADRNGTGWFDEEIALAACDDPDTVLFDAVHHEYDIWGDTYGDAPSRIETLFDEAQAHVALGEYDDASYDIGLLSHYLSDISNPLHTDHSDDEDAMHAGYENAVETRTDAPGENRAWVVSLGSPSTDEYGWRWAERAIMRAEYAHEDYATLVAEYSAHGFNAAVDQITRIALLRSVSGTASLIDSLDDGPVEYEGAARVAGLNRYSTSAMASLEAFPEGADTVLIATGTNWPDALCSAPLAVAHNAPLLLVKPNGVPAEIKAEINRLGATKAIILGGTAAVQPVVEAELKSQTSITSTTRIAGTSRYDTAAKIADEVIELRGMPSADRVFVATGENFPDALAASPVAGARGIPILLTKRTALSAETIACLQRHDFGDAIIVGGPVVVAEAVRFQLDSYFGSQSWRIAGSDRFETAKRMNEIGMEQFDMDVGHVGIAYGRNFPDALAAGVALAHESQSLLLCESNTLSSSSARVLADNRDGIQDVRLFGGSAVIDPRIEAHILTVIEPENEIAGRVPTRVNAWIDGSAIPYQNTNVSLSAEVLDQYGLPLPDAQVSFTWFFDSETLSNSDTSDVDGYAGCTRTIGDVTAGYTVDVEVTASRNGATATGTTSFTPRSYH